MWGVGVSMKLKLFLNGKPPVCLSQPIEGVGAVLIKSKNRDKVTKKKKNVGHFTVLLAACQNRSADYCACMLYYLVKYFMLESRDAFSRERGEINSECRTYLLALYLIC
jgi:hypothetical protein